MLQISALWQKIKNLYLRLTYQSCAECGALFSIPSRRAVASQLGEYSCRTDNLPVIECPSKHPVSILPDPEFVYDFFMEYFDIEGGFLTAQVPKRACCIMCGTQLVEDVQQNSVTREIFPGDESAFKLTVAGPSRRCLKCGAPHFVSGTKVHDVIMLMFREARIAKYLSFRPSKWG